MVTTNRVQQVEGSSREFEHIHFEQKIMHLQKSTLRVHLHL